MGHRTDEHGPSRAISQDSYQLSSTDGGDEPHNDQANLLIQQGRLRRTEQGPRDAPMCLSEKYPY
jgi:hypothetical protein